MSPEELKLLLSSLLGGGLPISGGDATVKIKIVEQDDTPLREKADVKKKRKKKRKKSEGFELDDDQVIKTLSQFGG